MAAFFKPSFSAKIQHSPCNEIYIYIYNSISHKCYISIDSIYRAVFYICLSILRLFSWELFDIFPNRRESYLPGATDLYRWYLMYKIFYSRFSLELQTYIHIYTRHSTVDSSVQCLQYRNIHRSLIVSY